MDAYWHSDWKAIIIMEPDFINCLANVHIYFLAELSLVSNKDPRRVTEAIDVLNI